jgi:hypothetical protein
VLLFVAVVRADSVYPRLLKKMIRKGKSKRVFWLHPEFRGRQEKKKK